MRLENGFGSIHNIDGKKVKGKRRKPFRARVSLELDEYGKRKYHTVGYFKTERAAYEALLEYHKAPKDSKTKITVKEIYEKLLETSFSNLSEGRLKTYRSTFKKISKLHKMGIDEVNLNHIEDVLTNQTLILQKNMLTLISKIFEWAIKKEIVSKNYALLMKAGEVKTKASQKQNSTNMTLEEVHHFIELEKQNVRCADVVVVLLYTGMRINELLQFKKNKVFLEEGYMVGGLKTENGKDRIIPIHPKIKHIIEKWLTNNNSDLLVNAKYTDSIILKFVKKHFPHHKTHNTRHTVTSRFVKLGVPDLMIKAIVGHDKGDVTTIYTHIDTEDLIEAMKKLNYDA